MLPFFLKKIIMESIEHFIKIELVKKKMTINSLCDEIGISDATAPALRSSNDNDLLEKFRIAGKQNRNGQ